MKKREIIEYCLSKNTDKKGNLNISFKEIFKKLSLDEASTREIVLDMESKGLITCWKAKQRGKYIDFIDIQTVTEAGKNLVK